MIVCGIEMAVVLVLVVVVVVVEEHVVVGQPSFLSIVASNQGNWNGCDEKLDVGGRWICLFGGRESVG